MLQQIVFTHAEQYLSFMDERDIISDPIQSEVIWVENSTEQFSSWMTSRESPQRAASIDKDRCFVDLAVTKDGKPWCRTELWERNSQ